MAQLFANEGHNVLALSRNNTPIAALNHPNISSFSFDLANESDYVQLDEFIKNNWKQVDILINNAGKLLNKPFLETSMQAFEEVYKVNVFGVANITKRQNCGQRNLRNLDRHLMYWRLAQCRRKCWKRPFLVIRHLPQLWKWLHISRILHLRAIHFTMENCYRCPIQHLNF